MIELTQELSVRLCQVEVPAGDAEAVEEVGDGGLDGCQDLSLQRTKYAGGQSGPSEPEGIEEVLYGGLDLSDAVLEDVLEQELPVQTRHRQTPTDAETCQEVLYGRLYGSHYLGPELAQEGVREASPGEDFLLQISQLQPSSS